MFITLVFVALWLALGVSACAVDGFGRPPAAMPRVLLAAPPVASTKAHRPAQQTPV